MTQEAPVAARLQELGIPFARYEHPPVFTADAAREHWSGIDAAHCKNLFLRNQKGTVHYLVVLPYEKQADLKAIAAHLGSGKLSFASPDRLLTHLGLTPGSVSPFGLINDRDHAVRVVIDQDLKGVDRISFHPNINTATFVIAGRDFERFLQACGNPVQYVAA